MENKFWTCPKCKRIFDKENQQHSCKVYPVEKHFKDRSYANGIYNNLKLQISKKLGEIRVESLPCCIHLVNKSTNYTFAAVYALKDRLRLHLALERGLRSKRILASSQLSSKRVLCSIDIYSKKEIDAELMKWIERAYGFKA